MNRLEPMLDAATEAELYRPASAELLAPELTAPSTPRLFDFAGRLSLPRFLLWHFGLVVALPWLLLVGAYFAWGGNWAAPATVLITIAPLNLLLSLSLFVRRARDLNLHGAWGVAAFCLPVLGTPLCLWLMVWPGSRGVNRRGPLNTPLGRVAQIVLALLAVGLLGAFGSALLYASEVMAFVSQAIQGLLQRL
ncbi:DUF805 domain-containing protein [Pseudomonas sp. UL073]|uniref:DUF805 domain-containing protein n=1 Tax=Zestomonas insulae TaxID=2809017 RepID=A0ABS2IDI0_9GAMM|nr:DUF805 domain-containing protein [Pseudomonas insulae]MBM7061161.1 DUF805 domain-containing protein [Pseudomonas insulae]